jgi:hypothetical protein
LLFCLALYFWILAEMRFKLTGRIIATLVLVIISGLNIYVIAMLIPGFEHGYHKQALLLCEQELERGNTQHVLQAIHTYNNVAATNSTYAAAADMLQEISKSKP